MHRRRRRGRRSRRGGGGGGGGGGRAGMVAAAGRTLALHCWNALAGRPPLLTAPELLPTQSSRRWVLPSQPADSKAAKVLLMSGLGYCFQSPFLPGKTDVHSISPLIRSLRIQVGTTDSCRRDALLTCTYPEIFARPSSGTS